MQIREEGRAEALSKPPPQALAIQNGEGAVGTFLRARTHGRLEKVGAALSLHPGSHRLRIGSVHRQTEVGRRLSTMGAEHATGTGLSEHPKGSA